MSFIGTMLAFVPAIAARVNGVEERLRAEKRALIRENEALRSELWGARRDLALTKELYEDACAECRRLRGPNLQGLGTPAQQQLAAQNLLAQQQLAAWHLLGQQNYLDSGRVCHCVPGRSELFNAMTRPLSNLGG